MALQAYAMPLLDEPHERVRNMLHFLLIAGMLLTNLAPILSPGLAAPSYVSLADLRHLAGLSQAPSPPPMDVAGGTRDGAVTPALALPAVEPARTAGAIARQVTGARTGQVDAAMGIAPPMDNALLPAWMTPGRRLDDAFPGIEGPAPRTPGRRSERAGLPAIATPANLGVQALPAARPAAWSIRRRPTAPPMPPAPAAP